MPQPLEYQTATATGRPLAWFHHIVSIFLCGFLWFTILVSTTFIVPRFETIFKDFKTALPGITQLFLTFSRWCGHEWGWIWLTLLLGCAVGTGFILDTTNPRPLRARRYSYFLWIITLLLILAYTAVAFLGLLLPMLSLIESVSTKK